MLSGFSTVLPIKILLKSVPTFSALNFEFAAISMIFAQFLSFIAYFEKCKGLTKTEQLSV